MKPAFWQITVTIAGPQSCICPMDLPQTPEVFHRKIFGSSCGRCKKWRRSGCDVSIFFWEISRSKKCRFHGIICICIYIYVYIHTYLQYPLIFEIFWIPLDGFYLMIRVQNVFKTSRFETISQLFPTIWVIKPSGNLVSLCTLYTQLGLGPTAACLQQRWLWQRRQNRYYIFSIQSIHDCCCCTPLLFFSLLLLLLLFCIYCNSFVSTNITPQ